MNKEARIKELEAQCNAMQAEIADLRAPPKVWTPPDLGPYSINGNLSVGRSISRNERNAVGNSFKTENSAQPAQRILGNAFMLDAYRRKFKPDVVQDRDNKKGYKYYPMYDHSLIEEGPWFLAVHGTTENPLQVYINKNEGQKLVDKLNAGTMKLKLHGRDS